MKKMHLYSTEGIDTSLLQVSEQDDAEHLNKELQYALKELTVLKRVLANSQKQIEILKTINRCQKKKLIRFARKLVQAYHLGYYDELTNLPNRRLLLNRLKQAMAQSDRQHKQIALLFIDLDKFKGVNDKLGHETGDKLLKQFAERLINSIRYGDTACRYGGDEFVIMLPEIDDMEDVAAVTKKICDQLSMPYLVNGAVIEVSASIGTTVYPAGGRNCCELIKHADIAMYLVKTRKNHPH
ncbi:MAG: GGDEF domain-containing protein [Nitrosomonas sp.]